MNAYSFFGGIPLSSHNEGSLGVQQRLGHLIGDIYKKPKGRGEGVSDYIKKLSMRTLTLW